MSRSVKKDLDLTLKQKRRALERRCDACFWIFSAIALGILTVGYWLGMHLYFGAILSIVCSLNLVVAWLASRYVRLCQEVAVTGKNPSPEGCKLMCRRLAQVTRWSALASFMFIAGVGFGRSGETPFVEFVAVAVFLLAFLYLSVLLDEAEEVL